MLGSLVSDSTRKIGDEERGVGGIGRCYQVPHKSNPEHPRWVVGDGQGPGQEDGCVCWRRIRRGGVILALQHDGRRSCICLAYTILGAVDYWSTWGPVGLGSGILYPVVNCTRGLASELSPDTSATVVSELTTIPVPVFFILQIHLQFRDTKCCCRVMWASWHFHASLTRLLLVTGVAGRCSRCQTNSRKQKTCSQLELFIWYGNKVRF